MPSRQEHDRWAIALLGVISLLFAAHLGHVGAKFAKNDVPALLTYSMFLLSILSALFGGFCLWTATKAKKNL